jgi:hypothetical protein
MADWQEEHRQRVAQFPDQIREAHRCSSNHRAAVCASTACGCFYCCSTFTPAEILDWVDEDADGKGQTALCPKCGIDAVLPAAPGFDLTPQFLAAMKAHWF